MGVPPEALLRSAYVTSLIQFKAKQISRKAGFNRSDEEDLVQQLTMFLLRQAEKYDPSRASVATFADRVLRTAIAMILRERRRLKRAAGFTAKSVDSGTVDVDSKEESLADVLTDADKARLTGTPATDPLAHMELAEAIERALAELPPAIAAIAEALKHGTVASVAQQLNVSRRQVKAAKEQIEAKFREVGLDFIEQPSIPGHIARRRHMSHGQGAAPHGAGKDNHMSAIRYRFQLSDPVPLEEAELTLHLSIFAVEGIYGEAGVRLDARYDVDVPGRALVIDATTEVGAALVRVFTNLLTREFGDGSFSVRRGSGKEPTPPAASSAVPMSPQSAVAAA